MITENKIWGISENGCGRHAWVAITCHEPKLMFSQVGPTDDQYSPWNTILTELLLPRVFSQTDGLTQIYNEFHTYCIHNHFDYNYVGIPVFIIVWWFAGFLIPAADWLRSRACESIWIMVPRRDAGSIIGSALEVIMSIGTKTIVVRIIRRHTIIATL